MSRGGLRPVLCLFVAALPTLVAQAFTEVLVSDETSLQASDNEISVVLFFDADLAAGKQITLSGLEASATGSFSRLGITVDNGTLADVGNWDTLAGTLKVTLARAVLSTESIHFRFTMRNPEADSNATRMTVACIDCATDGSALTTLTKQTQVMNVSYVKGKCATKRFYGDRCELTCKGIVRGAECICKPGQFGPDCDQGTIVGEARRVLLDANEAAVLLAGGQGVVVPAGALVEGAYPVEVVVRLYSLPPPPAVGEELYPTGRAMTVGPRWVVLAAPAQLRLDHDASKVHPGFASQGWRLSERSALWELLGGGEEESGLVEAPSRRFGTMAVMQSELPPRVAPAFTGLALGGEPVVQGEVSEISARLFFSWTLSAGSSLTLSGLRGAATRSASLAVAVDAVDGQQNRSVGAVGEWDQQAGAMTLRVLREVPPTEDIRLRFFLRAPKRDNPPANVTVECASCLAVPSFSFLRMRPLTVPSSLLGVVFQPPVCSDGRHEEGCLRNCSGTVVGVQCRCAPAQFGADCQQDAPLLARSYALYRPGSSFSLPLSDAAVGPRLWLPPRALEVGEGEAGVEVDARLYQVLPQPHPSQRLVPAGFPLVVLPRRPLAAPASVDLDWQPQAASGADGVELQTGAFMQDSESGLWERVEGASTALQRGVATVRVRQHLHALGIFAAFRYEPQDAPQFTSVLIRGTPAVQGQPCEVSVRVRANCMLAAGARLSFEGFLRSATPSSARFPVLPPNPDAPPIDPILAPPPTDEEPLGEPVESIGEWQQERGRLTVRLARLVAKEEEMSFRFSLLSDMRSTYGAIVSLSCPRCPAFTYPGTELAPITVTTSVLELLYNPPRCADPTLAGEDCSLRCQGAVLGTVCVCGAGSFGGDCNQTATVREQRSVVARPEAATVLSLTGGQGVTVPAGAVEEALEVEMAVYEVLPAPLPQQPLVPCGPAVVMSPHGKAFLRAVTLRLEHDPAKVPDGYRPSVHWLNRESGEWEDMGGEVGSGGVVAAAVWHFSTFAVMAAASPTPPPSTDTSAPPSLFPPPGFKARGDEQVHPGVIYAAIFGGIAVLFAVCVCYVLQHRLRAAASREAAAAAKHNEQSLQLFPPKGHTAVQPWSNWAARQTGADSPPPLAELTEEEYYSTPMPYLEGHVAATDGYITTVAASQLDRYAPLILSSDAVFQGSDRQPPPPDPAAFHGHYPEASHPHAIPGLHAPAPPGVPRPQRRTHPIHLDLPSDGTENMRFPTDAPRHAGQQGEQAFASSFAAQSTNQPSDSWGQAVWDV